MSLSRDPASVLDLSRAPRGELVATQLVAAAAKYGDLAERHYLELKGPTDLVSKMSRQKVAKFILGAANRMPTRAAEAFEGYGVMIVGITKNGVEGVPPVEMNTLAQVVQPFLGADGPRWDIVRVPVPDSTNQAIVVLVDPPLMGQGPFVCRASGDGLQDGRTYVRADGETREPTSGEWDQLMARGATKPAAPVALEVGVLGRVAAVVIDAESTLEEFVTKTRKRLVNAIPATEAPQTASSPTATSLADVIGMAGGFSKMMEQAQTSLLVTVKPETRTEDEYRNEIDLWENKLRDAWPEAVDRFVRYTLPPNEISITNKTQTFLHDVEVKLHLAGSVTTLEPEYATANGFGWSDLRLPTPPRDWGPTKQDIASSLYAQHNWASLTASPFTPPPSFPQKPSTSWANGGSVDVSVDVGDLRPEAVFESDDAESILIIREDQPATVLGTWKATVRGYNEVFTGTLKVEVDAPAVLTGLLREFLGLR